MLKGLIDRSDLLQPTLEKEYDPNPEVDPNAAPKKNKKY
jgi:hypothetical protein